MKISSRREFSKQLMAIGCTGLTHFCCKSNHSTQLPIALQLYTVRELAKKDFKGTIRKVAEIGYPAVEFAGYGGLNAKEVKQLLAELNLKCAGVHEGFENLENDLAEIIAFNKRIGNVYITCSSMPTEFRGNNLDKVLDFSQRLNTVGKKLSAEGLQLCYHNHAFEFERIDEKYVIDIIFENTDPANVKAEVDVYWVQKGGEDPVAFIKKYANRCAILHMKDMTRDEEQTFAPVGTGSLDMQSIVKTGRQIGVDWYIVEQDRTQRPALEAVEISYNNLNAVLKSQI